MRKVDNGEKNEGGWKAGRKKERKLRTEVLATNIIASQSYNR